MEKIDFVITWVDGADPEWQKEFLEYKDRQELEGKNPEEESVNNETDSSVVRYRSWDNLQYWFRAVEKYAPWVNKIHFITWGHLPPWLNTESPKLNIVKHTDYIPEKYLPTFNSHTIEFNIHRIEGLAENFVYFNDDQFIGKEVEPTDFFRKGLPCDQARLYPLGRYRNKHAHMVLNNVNYINAHYRASDIRRNFWKWVNFRYSIGAVMRTLSLMQFSFVPGFKDHHQAFPLTRSMLKQIWDTDPRLADETCSHRFRSILDITPWLVRYSAFMEGKFSPISVSKDRNFKLIERNAVNIENALKSKKYRLICLNDDDEIADFEKLKGRIITAFDHALPDKSTFEL